MEEEPVEEEGKGDWFTSPLEISVPTDPPQLPCLNHPSHVVRKNQKMIILSFSLDLKEQVAVLSAVVASLVDKLRDLPREVDAMASKRASSDSQKLTSLFHDLETKFDNSLQSLKGEPPKDSFIRTAASKGAGGDPSPPPGGTPGEAGGDFHAEIREMRSRVEQRRIAILDYYEGDAKILAAADKAQTGAEEYLVARMAVRILKSLQSKAGDGKPSTGSASRDSSGAAGFVIGCIGSSVTAGHDAFGHVAYPNVLENI